MNENKTSIMANPFVRRLIPVATAAGLSFAACGPTTEENNAENNTAANKITVPLARKLLKQTRGAVSDLESELGGTTTTKAIGKPAAKGSEAPKKVNRKSKPNPMPPTQRMNKGGALVKKTNNRNRKKSNMGLFGRV